MASFWDLLPAGLWPVQPFVWPPDPMQRAPGPQETEPPQRSAATAPAFGWAPARAAAASAPAFGWATAPAAPASAPAYSGATDPNAFLGSFPESEALDPARSARLLENAQRAHAFALWAFGPPSPRPAQQIGDAAARRDGIPAPDDWPGRNAAALSADARGAFAANAAAPAVAADAAALPPNRADQSDAPVGNGDAVPTQAADAAQPPALTAATGNPNIERQGERIRASAAARQPPPAFVRAAADDFGHGLRETPLQVVGGMRDAGQALIDLQNWAADHHVPLFPGIPFTPHALFDLPDVRQPESYTGGAVRAVSQFLAGFAAGGPAAEAAGLRGTAQMLARGAGADFLFRGGHDQRLSDLLEQVPALKNPVTDYLKSNPDDSEAEGRLKNALEGLALGGLGAALFRTIRAIRDYRFRPAKAVERGPPETQSEPVVEPNPAPLTEEMAEPTVGPSHIEEFRARIGVPTRPTVAVARTSVPGLEEVTFEGASPFVRDEGGLPRATPGRIKSPSPYGFDQGHAEEDLANQFLRAVEERGLKPSDLDGHKLVIYVSNPRGVSGICRSEDPPGVLMQLSHLFPGLTIEVRVQTQPGITPRGPTNFVIKNKQYISGSNE